MELEFQAADFSNLMFDVTRLPDNIDPVKFFPKLDKYEEFKNTNFPNTKKARIFKYIVYMYDKESPFKTKIPDLYKRKIEIAKYVKLISDPKFVDEAIKKILRSDDYKVNRMIISYCRMQCNPLYSLVEGLNEVYYTDLLSVRNKEETKKPLEKTQAELQKASQELLTQDNTPSLLKSLFDFIEEERINDLRPEGIAEIFSQGKKPFEGEEVNYNDDDNTY